MIKPYIQLQKRQHVAVIFRFSLCLITMDIPLFFTTDGLVFKFTFLKYNHDCGSLYCQYMYIQYNIIYIIYNIYIIYTICIIYTIYICGW